MNKTRHARYRNTGVICDHVANNGARCNMGMIKLGAVRFRICTKCRGSGFRHERILAGGLIQGQKS